MSALCLHEGIKPIFLGSNICQSQLLISDGTMVIDGAFKDIYETGAIIPRPPWRALNSLEIQKLSTSTRPCFGNSVKIVSLDQKIYDAFSGLREIAKKSGKKVAEMYMHKRPAEYAFGLREIAQFSERFLNKQTLVLGAKNILVKKVPFPTTTINSKTRLYTGLHVDSFSRAALNERALSPGRLCFNLGYRERFLFFVNISLWDIAERLKYHMGESVRSLSVGSSLGDKFLSLFQDYPVVSLRVKPGQGYIAPTENIIHDGSFCDKDEYDITLTIHGIC